MLKKYILVILITIILISSLVYFFVSDDILENWTSTSLDIDKVEEQELPSGFDFEISKSNNEIEFSVEADEDIYVPQLTDFKTPYYSAWNIYSFSEENDNWERLIVDPWCANPRCDDRDPCLVISCELDLDPACKGGTSHSFKWDKTNFTTDSVYCNGDEMECYESQEVDSGRYKVVMSYLEVPCSGHQEFYDRDNFEEKTFNEIEKEFVLD